MLRAKINKVLYCLVFTLVFLALAVSASAANPDLHASKISTSFYIEYGKTLVDTNIFFDTPADGELEFRLPLDARAITMKVDGSRVEPELDYNIVTYTVENASRVRLQYISESFLEKNSFICNAVPPIDTDFFVMKVSLPEGALLERSVGEGIDKPSVFPKPSKMYTDGRVIDVVWEESAVTSSDEFPIMVRFVDGFEWPLAIIIGGTILLGAGLIFILYRLIQQRSRLSSGNDNGVREKVEPATPKHHAPELHLKEDEAQIVNILKAREKQCEQGTLRVITGFSKAKLSGLLKELEERKIVHKEKRGKKNLVFLKY